MKISEILTPEMVVPRLSGQDKPHVLNELAGCLAAKRRGVDLHELNAVLNERERLGSTAIGDGIAIPHGKIRGVDQIVGVFGRAPQGVEFESLDGKPTSLFFFAGGARGFGQPAPQGSGASVAAVSRQCFSRSSDGRRGCYGDLPSNH